MSEIIKTKGRILQIHDRYSFIVYLEKDNLKMNATISKTLKAYQGKKLNIGDSVIIEYSPFDLTKGRIHHHSFRLF